jgi:integrase
MTLGNIPGNNLQNPFESETGVPLVSRVTLECLSSSRARTQKLANDGVDTRTIQAYLGHKSIQHTVRYTELAPTRFKSLFRD